MNRDGFDVNDSPSGNDRSRHASNADEGASSQSPIRQLADELRFLQQRREQIERYLEQQQRNEMPVGSFHRPLPPIYPSSIPFLGAASTAQKASQLTASALAGGALSQPIADRYGFMQRPSPPDIGTYYSSPSRPAYLQRLSLPYASASPAKLSRTRPTDEQVQDEMSEDQQKPRAMSYDFPLPPTRGEARRIAPPKLDSYHKLWNSTISKQPSGAQEEQHRRDTFRIKMGSGKVDMEQDSSITGRYRRRRDRKRQRRDHTKDATEKKKQRYL